MLARIQHKQSIIDNMLGLQRAYLNNTLMPLKSSTLTGSINAECATTMTHSEKTAKRRMNACNNSIIIIDPLSIIKIVAEMYDKRHATLAVLT